MKTNAFSGSDFDGIQHSGFIEQYTGITNAMVQAAPPAAAVMADALRFVGHGTPMVAHNASFDRRFWESELSRIDHAADNPFACTLLLSRRMYPEAVRFNLGAMVAFHDLPPAGRAHRAMADAEMAASLFSRIRRDLERRWNVFDASHEVLMALQGATKAKVPAVISRFAQ